jgi:hypothetical protein
MTTRVLSSRALRLTVASLLVALDWSVQPSAAVLAFDEDRDGSHLVLPGRADSGGASRDICRHCGTWSADLLDEDCVGAELTGLYAQLLQQRHAARAWTPVALGRDERDLRVLPRHLACLPIDKYTVRLHG